MTTGKKIFLFAWLAVVILSIAFAGLLVYFQGKNFPFLDKVMTVPLLESPPDSLIVMSRKNLAKLITAHYEFNARFEDSGSAVPYTVDSQVVYDGGFNEALAGQLSWKNQIKLKTLSFLFNTEGVFTPEKYYFRITEAPAVPFVDMAEVTGKWYEAAVPKSQTAVLSAWHNFLVSSKIFSVSKRLPDETLDGQLCYRLVVVPDRASLESLLKFLQPAGRAMTSGNFNKSLYASEIDLWINKKSHNLVKLSGQSGDNGQSFDFELYISRLDEKVTIETPVTAETLSQLADELFNQTNFLDWPLFGYLVGLDATALAQDKDADGLYDVWENIMGTDPAKADTDADGFNDSDELRHGYNPQGPGKLFSL